MHGLLLSGQLRLQVPNPRCSSGQLLGTITRCRCQLGLQLSGTCSISACRGGSRCSCLLCGSLLLGQLCLSSLQLGLGGL